MTAYSQREIVPLPLDGLDRDSLNSIIRQEEKDKNYQALGRIYGGIFNYFLYSDFKDSAIIYGGKAEENTYKAGDSARYYFMQLQLGEFYTGIDFEKSLAFHKKALSYYIREKNYTLQGNALGGLSYLYELQKDTVNQIRYLDLAEKVSILAKDTFNIMGANHKRAQIMMGRNEYDPAINVLKNNLALIKKAATLGNSESIRVFWKGWELNLLAACYYHKNKFSLAIRYLKEAQQYDRQTAKFDAQNIFRLRYLINSYIMSNHKDSAIQNVEAFFAQGVKTLTNLDPGKLNEITAKYETEKKQRQILELQQQNHLQQLAVSAQRKLNSAFIGIFLLALISGYFIVKYNRQKRKMKAALERQRAELEKKKAIETERYRISSELHDDMGGGLSTIRLLSEMIKRDALDGDAGRQLNVITESSKELVQKMNEIVWALNISNDNLQSLLIYIRQYAVKFLEGVALLCKTQMPDHIPDIHVPGNDRRNIFLLVKEALNNVVKHAGAKTVFISMEVNDALSISIRDDGRGISSEALKTKAGNGLRNMLRRTEEMDGSLEIKAHNGTTIHFTFPVAETNTKG